MGWWFVAREWVAAGWYPVLPELRAVQSDPKACVVEGGHLTHFQSGLAVSARLVRVAVGLAVVLDQTGASLVKVHLDAHLAACAVVGVGDLCVDRFHLLVSLLVATPL